MIDNSGNKMRILFHICKEVSDSKYDKLSDIQKDIVETWAKIRGNLFSISQVAYRNSCSRGKVQKAVRQLEKRGVVRRYCGGHKTRWNAILCDECGKEFESIDIRFFVQAIYAWTGSWKVPIKSRHIKLTTWRNGEKMIFPNKQYNAYGNRGWIYEARICSECLNNVLRARGLETIKLASFLLGMNNFEQRER